MSSLFGKRKTKLDAVTVTGGEPTLQPDNLFFPRKTEGDGTT